MISMRFLLRQLALVCLMLSSSEPWCADTESVRPIGERRYAYRTWEDLYSKFCATRGDVDGVEAGEVGESVSFLLREKWVTLHELVKIGHSSPLYVKFVLKFLDESLPHDEAEAILALATRACPSPEDEWLCIEIADRLK